MAEEKKVPTGAEAIKYYIKEYKDRCKWWEDLIEVWKESVKNAKKSGIALVIDYAERGLEEAIEGHLKCRDKLIKLKYEIPEMVEEWERYWNKKFPYYKELIDAGLAEEEPIEEEPESIEEEESVL
jgi:hypothetical protein